MLVRAARRNVRPDHFRSRFLTEQSNLPWLSSNHATSQRSRRWGSIAKFAPSFALPWRRRRDSNNASTLTTCRAMATAIELSSIDDIPFVGMDMMPSFSGPDTATSLGPLFDIYHGHAPLNLGGSTVSRGGRFRSTSATMAGGTLEELQSVFEACLQIGRIERAGALLKKILTVELSHDEQIALHRRYLRSAAEDILVNPSEASMQSLHKWFELEIRSQGIAQDVEMVAYMVKASLHSHQGQRQRLVKRYMDMLEKGNVLGLLSMDVLTGREIHMITEIYPKYNFVLNDLDFALEEELEVEEGDLNHPKQPHYNADHVISDVKSMEQKGLGLKSLKKALSMFTIAPTEGINLAKSSEDVKRSVQERIESDAVESAVERWRDENIQLTKMGLNTNLQTKSLGGRMFKWQLALEAHLRKEMLNIDAVEAAGKANTDADAERGVYGPFLRILSTEKLAAVTILSTMGTLATMGADKGIPLSAAIMNIAKNIEEESIFAILQQEKRSKLWPKTPKGKASFSPKAFRRASRSHVTGAAAKYASQFLAHRVDLTTPRHEWPGTVKAKVGALLLSALIEVAQVPVAMANSITGEELTQLQPAFGHSYNYRLGKKLGIITANKSIVAQLAREPVHDLLAKHLPMLVEPDPWTAFNKGGFISHPGKIMRIKNGDKDQRHYAEAAIDQGDMEVMFAGLNSLGKTPWKINRPVFDVMLEAWNSGEAIANIPPEAPNISIPPEPESVQDPLVRRRWIRAVRLAENKRGGLHSQRCFQNFQLEIARALVNEKFYFPHNIDFRGRAYPIPPYLNHMGADHCRGLLTFGEGKELGETGLKWLKIHLANVFGFDKASLSERAEFTMKNLDSIIDSAKNPLKGERWWLLAEDPWQCLAACVELNQALSSPEPARFISHLPIHQDGTCNGLQHYAALGGDMWGAKQVNLEPGDRPADVYTAVAEIVKAQIADDKASGHALATFLDGKITRKTVKQTVMTNVYGVTFTGARAQVRKQLIAAYPDLVDSPGTNATELAGYVATKIFNALSTMFKGAHDIQHWLGECANRISCSLTEEQLLRFNAELTRLQQSKSKSKGTADKNLPSIEELTQFKSSVIWTSPVHMPVVQPYRESKSRLVHTNLQRISLSEPHISDPVSRRKQLQGFPPNFIHSLDATHMILSALRCNSLGLSFAAVHDSFWTHASDVNTMNEALRDAFIKIHSDDVIQRLRAEFATRHKGCIYRQSIASASPSYKRLVKWRAGRSKEREAGFSKLTAGKNMYLDELALEYKRQKLLNSEVAKDVQQGKDMVTAASILEEMNCLSVGQLGTAIELAGLGDLSGSQATFEETSDDRDLESDSSLSTCQDVETATDDDLEPKSESSSLPEEESLTSFEKGMNPRWRQGQSRPSQRNAPIHVWLPLTFPEVPEKGDFDVSRLKDSAYFFS